MADEIDKRAIVRVSAVRSCGRNGVAFLLQDEKVFLISPMVPSVAGFCEFAEPGRRRQTRSFRMSHQGWLSRVQGRGRPLPSSKPNSRIGEIPMYGMIKKEDGNVDPEGSVRAILFLFWKSTHEDALDEAPGRSGKRNASSMRLPAKMAQIQMEL